MKKILLFPFTLLALFIGQISWLAPPWLLGLHQLVRGHIKASIVVLILLISSVAGFLYYDSLPKPVMIKATIDKLHITPNYSSAKPSNLNIHFAYDFSQMHKDQARPEGQPSVARIDLVAKAVTNGISLSPAKKGQWMWLSDRRLQFVPETDWPAGTEYTVSFESSIFAADTLLSKSSYTITSPVLKAEFSHIEFYQDPQYISIRRVIATLEFSHPIDKTSLEASLALSMRGSGEIITIAEKPYQFTVSYDKNYRTAYIQSEAIALPKQSNYMKVSVKEGLVSILGGQASKQAEETKIFIPDVYSFLKIDANSQIVRNEKNQPEQLVMLNFTDNIGEKELMEKLSMYLLPAKGQRNGKRYWKGPRQVNNNVLHDSEKVVFSAIANEKNSSKVYNFKVDIPEGRFLYIKVDKGLTSVNQFVHASFYDEVLRAPNYPKEVDISGEGAVLTYSGNHQLSVLTRGVPALKYTVGRLLPGQLYHLISQTRGDINNPSFKHWNFNEHNIADFETQIIPLSKAHAKIANYSSIDLSQFLPKEKNQFGLFFIDVKGYDEKRQQEIYQAHDKRLILVTDLGVIVKNNSDKSHDVFVQSIANGLPVAAAQVELLGRNGVPIFTGFTDERGHVAVPITAMLSTEKTPTVYVIKSGNDLSFIPFDWHSRQINLSKFDIGGVQVNNANKQALNAFIFSDRGIYRPGEIINFAMIVKQMDLSNVENIPLELVIRGPRNKELRVNKFKLPAMGFADFQFPSTASSDTGRYTASLHLVRDNRYRGREIGSTGFKIEEFQPDTMKIESKLLNVVNKGWNTESKITARVSLKNLFGTAAQDRKMQARLTIQPHHFRFIAYEDYTFTDTFFDKNQKPLSVNRLLSDSRTDADGIVEFDLDVSQFKQGTYRLSFTVEGFDQAGGRSVIAANSAFISPLSILVGYKSDGKLDYINAKSKRQITFIAIDQNLKKKTAENLSLRLIEIQSVSTLIKQKNGTYKYQTIKKEVEVSSKAFVLSASGYQYDIDTASPGDYALEIIDDKNRSLSRVPFSVVGFANLSGKIDKNAELQLKLDKSDYFPGDMITMNIKAPYIGTGLITIETDKVQQFSWFKTDQESTVQSIQIPDDLEGTAYVNVAFVRDISSKEVFTSPLSYAVQPFSLDKSKRRITIELNTKAIVRPGQPMQIQFKTNKPARIAVFAIDEGILQVANYQTPDPLSHFLKKRALGVETLQILDLILPDFNIVKALSASGGGSAKKKALAKNLNPFARKTDKPAVFWSGIYAANDKKNTVTFDVPDTFAGELRIMAVAVSEDAVGAASTSAIVRGPFVLSPNVLMQAAPGDEFLVTVGVANIIQGSGEHAEVALSVSASKQLKILSDAKVLLNIDEGGEAKFTFKVRATSHLGAAQLTFTAKHKNE
ncbi:MAG: alpha-2-macroglobulin family protein, partial [Pseudomonadales bacterium]|nr:alpha-2-macroglobulin family protein [Pseudomonadales bacterium]